MSDEATAAAGPSSALTQNAKALEDLAVTTLMSLMTNTNLDPDVRRKAALDTLRALGKADPSAGAGPRGGTLVLNFAQHLPEALTGMKQAIGLMAGTGAAADDAEVRRG